MWLLILWVPLFIVEDQHQFIFDHRFTWKGGDVDVVAPLLESCLKAYPDIGVCSFDRGFHSPENQERLGELLETTALPKKGIRAPRSGGARPSRPSRRRVGAIPRLNRRSTILNSAAWTGSVRGAPPASSGRLACPSWRRTCTGSD